MKIQRRTRGGLDVLVWGVVLLVAAVVLAPAARGQPAPPAAAEGGAARGVPAWSDVSVRAGARVVVVDADVGDDANDGVRAPVKTLPRGYALLRNNSSDQLWLRGRFTAQRIGDGSSPFGGGFKLSGRSPDAPLVIRSAPGSRATIDAGGLYPCILGWAEDGSAPAHVSIVGIDFVAGTRVPGSARFDVRDAGGEAIRWVGSGFAGWTIEDCGFRAFSGALSLDNDNVTRPHTGIVIRGNRILDSYGGWQPGPGEGTRGHSSGMYMKGAKDVLIEYNLFDHNGWQVLLSLPEAPRTTYNHSIYSHGVNDDVTVRWNIITNSAFAGVQARGGRIDLIDNYLQGNPAHLSAGHAQAVWPQQAWTGTMLHNVAVRGADISLDERRGWGIGASRADDRGDASRARIAGNIVALNLTAGGGPAISIGELVKSLTVQRNIVYRWRGSELDGGNALVIEAPITGDVVIEDNDFQQVRGGLALLFAPDFGGATLRGNRWFTASAAGKVIRRHQRSSVPLAFAGSIGNVDGDEDLEISYPEPGRDAERYAREVLELRGEWLQAARAMTRETWDARLTAPAINDWIRAGYGISAAPGGDAQ